MAKRAKKLKACHKRGSSEARITELPDEIIVYILSLLTMKEAGRTSVLSKRWRYVWAYIPVLNFDASKTLVQLMLDEKQLEVEKTWYLSWVDQVVSSYRGLAIDEFTVRFDVDESNEHNIDKWVKFVMEKRVKRLQFDFSDTLGLSRQKCYTFSCLSFCNSLTSLQLLYVNVTGDVLENFLNNCPQIEFVKVHGSESLVNLNVPGASVNLKYLEIMLCFEVKEIEIYAPNLVSFKYFGPKISVPFKNTLKIVELFIGGDYAIHLSKNFSELSSYLYQLEVLTLDVAIDNEHIQGFPLCPKLKQLELIVDPDDEGDLFGLRSLINACPFLHKFILQLEWCEPNLRRRRIKRKKVCPHYHLKIVEIVGFVGHAIDLEFIMYLMKSCVALEKIVIDPRSPIDLGTPWEFENEKRIRTVRVQAEKLRAKLKPSVDLIII